jgi:hypothetical protein
MALLLGEEGPLLFTLGNVSDGTLIFIRVCFSRPEKGKDRGKGDPPAPKDLKSGKENRKAKTAKNDPEGESRP